MPRIAPVDPAHADADVKATLAAVKAKIGIVPNLFSTFAQSPAVLNGYLALSDALGKGVLTAAQRDIIALAVGQANECSYCLSAHTLMGKGAGLSQEGIRKAREGKGETAIDDAIASFARRVIDARAGLGRGSCRRAFGRSRRSARHRDHRERGHQRVDQLHQQRRADRHRLPEGRRRVSSVSL